jgi:hypothetical protein
VPGKLVALSLGGPPRPGWSILSAEQNNAMLTAACQGAGVSLGAWDQRISHAHAPRDRAVGARGAAWLRTAASDLSADRAHPDQARSEVELAVAHAGGERRPL